MRTLYDKIILSAITALTLGSVGANALELYQDTEGQVFTTPAERCTLLSGSIKNMNSTESNGITIIKQDSPEFLLGKETHINMKFVPEDAPDMWLKAGVRIQGTMESKSTDYTETAKADTNLNDAYLRRARFEVAAGFGKHASFVMDVRNDKSNYGLENSEGAFNVGDAYVKIKKPWNTSLVNFKLYRAKIDVSRTETVKSARVIAYDRPYVADAAAQYISFNRRGANVQMHGDWEKKVHYQVAAGAAANPGKVKDAQGNSGSDIELSEQSFFYGAATLNLGTSSGWYATSEYVFSDFYYVAPFLRYESWDKFEGEDGYKSTSTIAGVNWYVRGNTTKVGMYYQKDEHDVNIFRITSQWFF